MATTVGPFELLKEYLDSNIYALRLYPNDFDAAISQYQIPPEINSQAFLHQCILSACFEPVEKLLLLCICIKKFSGDAHQQDTEARNWKKIAHEFLKIIYSKFPRFKHLPKIGTLINRLFFELKNCLDTYEDEIEGTQPVAVESETMPTGSSTPNSSISRPRKYNKGKPKPDTTTKNTSKVNTPPLAPKSKPQEEKHKTNQKHRAILPAPSKPSINTCNFCLVTVS